MTMGKTIIIDEQKESELIGRIFESVFYPNVQQVLDVEEYLNKNFRPKKILTTDNITQHSKFQMWLSKWLTELNWIPLTVRNF